MAMLLQSLLAWLREHLSFERKTRRFDHFLGSTEECLRCPVRFEPEDDNKIHSKTLRRRVAFKQFSALDKR